MDVINKRLIAGAMKMDAIEINNKNDKNDNNKYNDDDDNNKDSKLSDELEEPIPRNDHKYCHICKTKFEKYIKHIKCFSHFENLERNQTFFNRFKKSFERIINFWDNKYKRNQKNKIKNNNNIETNTKLSIKSDETSTTKECNILDKNTHNNNINVLNNIPNNNENNNTTNNNINNNNIIKNKNENNIKTNNNITKKNINVNQNIDLNKTSKNIQNNGPISFNNYNNNKNEEKSKKNIFTSFYNYNQNTIKKNSSDNHIFNLTYNSNIINTTNSKNNNIIIKNSLYNLENSLNSIKTINYISISKEFEDNLNKNKVDIKKEEKSKNQSKKKFVTKCYPKFSTLQTFQIPKPKKRKKNDYYKGGDIFVISTPKKIEFDYFPILSAENPKKLINKNIILFQ